MTLIDTHAHIYLEEFKEDIEEVIDRARDNGIEKILMPNIDEASIEDMLALEQKYPDLCYPMMGLHPCSVKEDFQKQLYKVEEWLSKRSFIAVGEMGTDLYWDKTHWAQQQEAFKIQCDLAQKHSLPIVIHCRESIDETIQLLRNGEGQEIRGVFHCFTGDSTQGDIIANELGFHLGLGGVVTFKNSGMDKVVPDLNPDQIVLETDSPYLSPAPNRGKRNEPAQVSIIGERVATYFDKSFKEIAELTTKNANDLFFRP